MKKQIKLMADYYCWPIWWEGNHEPGNINPRTLPIPEEIILELEEWSEIYNATLNEDYPGKSGFAANKAQERFNQQGINLWKKLITYLSSDYEVWYFHPSLHTVLKSPQELDS